MQPKSRVQYAMSKNNSTMFDNLITFKPDIEAVGNFTPLKKVDSAALLDAQAATADWLEELGVPSDQELDAQQQTKSAREAFTGLNFTANDEKKKALLVAVKTPTAVRHLTGMLTAYDWEFVQQAKELRGYTVSKILEETTHPDARIRLKALQMLGNVTEVALFTERVEVTKKDASEEEVERRLRDRLSKFLKPQSISDAVEVARDQEVANNIDTEIEQVAERRDA
jgi:hypothetical protein